MLLTSTQTRAGRCSPMNAAYTSLNAAKSSMLVTNTVVLAMSVTARPAASSLHVRQRLDGLFFHPVADDFPGNGVKGDLTAQVIGGTGLDAMGIGADRRAGLGRMNEFHNKSFGGGRRFTAERFLTASQSTYGSKSGIARESSPGRGLHSGAWLSPRAQETILPCLRARAADMQPPSHVALF